MWPRLFGLIALVTVAVGLPRPADAEIKWTYVKPG
jgi:hypothetical protein